MKVFKVLVVHVQTVTLSASQSSYVYYPIISSSIKWLVDCLVGLGKVFLELMFLISKIMILQ